MKPQHAEKPTGRPDDIGWDRWFDYYHAEKAQGFRITLRDIGAETGYSDGYVRQKHAEYLKRHSQDDKD